MEAVELPAQEIVDRFLPPREMPVKLEPSEPHAFGGMMFPDCFMEQRYKIEQAMTIAAQLIREERDTWKGITDRALRPIHCYRTEDAEVVALCLGTAFGALRAAVDKLRGEGIKVGAIRMWQYRPFPIRELKGKRIGPGRAWRSSTVPARSEWAGRLVPRRRRCSAA